MLRAIAACIVGVRGDRWRHGSKERVVRSTPIGMGKASINAALLRPYARGRLMAACGPW